MAQTMRAWRPGSSARRPKAEDARRVCRSPQCDTVISRYNRADYCYTHAPRRFPRVRGEFTSAYMERQAGAVS